MRLVLLLVCLQLSRSQISSQNQLEIGVIYSPSYSKLTTDFFEPRFFHSFGLEMQRTLKSNVTFGVGVYLRRFGARFELPPDFTHLRPYKVSYLTSSIGVPITIGYNYISGDRFRAGISTGIENCVLLDQKGERPERTSEIGIYKSYLLGFIAALPFHYQLNSNAFVKIEPFGIRQLNKNKSPISN